MEYYTAVKELLETSNLPDMMSKRQIQKNALDELILYQVQN